MTSTMPARNTRRGPNTSAALPAVGCAIALARYRAVTSAAVCPIDTSSPRAIGTRAVAINELLTGLSAEPMNNGAVNRHENGCSAGGPIATGVLIEDPEADIRISSA
jgi:hypothetical protein